jgi:hypothetical protein
MDSPSVPSKRPGPVLRITAVLALGLATMVAAACGQSPSQSPAPSSSVAATDATPATGATVAIDPAWAAVIGGRSAFWLGPEVNGMPVTDVRDADGRILVEYGPCMDQPEPSDECVRQLGITTQTPAIWEEQAKQLPGGDPGAPESEAEICDQHPPVLGVPAAVLLGELTVFTGPSLVGVHYWEQIADRFSPDDMRRRLASQLRPIGHATPATLPPPEPNTIAIRDRHCEP